MIRKLPPRGVKINSSHSWKVTELDSNVPQIGSWIQSLPGLGITNRRLPQGPVYVPISLSLISGDLG